jgi:hypothetical protein
MNSQLFTLTPAEHSLNYVFPSTLTYRRANRMRAQELPAKDCPHQTLETYGETHAVHHPSRTLSVDKISSYLWTQSCKQKFYAT